jgi:hypothetical protein
MYDKDDMKEVFGGVDKLSKDILQSMQSMTDKEVKFLVQTYYIIQETRIQVSNRYQALLKEQMPNQFWTWAFNEFEKFENQIKKALKKWVEQQPIWTEWAVNVKGLGPIIIAGMVAYVDINKINSAGQLISYAGLVPGQERKRNEKIKWNPDVKKLCFNIGEVFVKSSNSFYQDIYRRRKEYEIGKNNNFDYKDQAKGILRKKTFKDTNCPTYKAYASGKLSDGHIHMRAKRYATKMFLSHFFEVYYTLSHGKPPPMPYVIDILGHKDYVAPPEWIKAEDNPRSQPGCRNEYSRGMIV